MARVVAQLSQFNDGLDAITTGIRQAGESHARPQTLADTTIAQLEKIISNLRAVPVDIKVVVDDEEGGIDIRKIETNE